MCWLCDELGSMPSCTDCGILICFDVKHGDDVISSARMTDDGDVLCEDCYRSYREQEEEEAADLDFGFFEDVMGDPFGGAVGFDVQTAAGNTAHVLVDPDMDPKTAAALEQLIDAAHQAIEDGTLKPDDRSELDDIDLPF